MKKAQKKHLPLKMWIMLKKLFFKSTALMRQLEITLTGYLMMLRYNNDIFIS